MLLRRISNLNIIRRIGMSKVIKACSFCSINDSRIKNTKYNGSNSYIYGTKDVNKKLSRKKKITREKI